MASDQLNVAVSLPTIVGMPPVLAQVRADTAAILALLNGGTPAPTPTVTFLTPVAISVTEGGAGETKTLTFYVGRSTTSGAVSIPYTFSAGSTNAADYPNGLPGNGTVNIADGQLGGTIVITIAGDADIESNESFTLTLTAPQGYASGVAMSATGTILNDDSAATMSLSNKSIANGSPENTRVGQVQGVPAGSTLILASPTNNSLKVVQDGGLWYLAVGSAGVGSAGTIAVQLTATGAQTLSDTITVTAAIVLQPATAPAPAYGPSGVLSFTSGQPGVRVDTGSQDHFVEAQIATSGNTKIAVSMVDTDATPAYGSNQFNPNNTPTINVFARKLFGRSLAWQPNLHVTAGEIWGFRAKSDVIELYMRSAANAGQTPGTGTLMDSVPAPERYAYVGGRSTFAGTLAAGKDDVDTSDYTLSKLAIGALVAPLTITDARFSSDRSITTTLAYVGSPNGYRQRLVSAGGATLVDYTDATVKSSAAAGQAVISGIIAPASVLDTFFFLDVQQKNDATIVQRREVYGKRPLQIGTNASAIETYATRRRYGNLAQQGQWSSGSMYPRFVNTYGLLDSDGNLTGLPDGSNGSNPGNMARRMVLPDDPCFVVITWDGGLPASQHTFTIQGNGPVLSQRTNPDGDNGRKIRIYVEPATATRVDTDWALQVNGTAGAFSTPMTNLRAYPEGEDRTARWAPSYISFISQFRGPIRHMDDTATNPQESVDYTPVWANRPTRAYFATHPLGMCIEDMIELSNLTGRGCYINSNYLWTQDFIQKTIAGIDTGALMAGGVKLNAGLQIIFEPMNEPWNSAFPIYTKLRAGRIASGRGTTAQDNVGGGAFAANHESVYIFNLHNGWARAMQASKDRLLCAVGTQQFGNWPEMVSPTNWSGFGLPAQQDPALVNYDIVMGAPYITGTDASRAAAKDPATQYPIIRAYIESYLNDILVRVIAVRRAGKRTGMYELSTENRNSYAMDAAQWQTFRRSQQFYDLFYYFWSRIRDDFGDIACQFTDCGGSDYAAEEYPGADSPMLRAILAVQATI